MGQSRLIRSKKVLVTEPLRPIFPGKILPYEIEVFSDINICKSLWDEFSPKRNLFETWEFRYAFYLGYGYRPYFLVARKNRKNVALLPLWFDSKNKYYTWFGSEWQEELSFFLKDREAMRFLIEYAPSPLVLNALTKEAILPYKDYFQFEEDDPKYVLDISCFSSHEDYLMTLRKNERRNLRKDRNRILKQNPEVVFNQFSDFEHMVNLAKERFKLKGEDTDWDNEERVNTFKKIIELAGISYQIRMITVKIGGEYAGVDLIAIYKGRYYALKCGYNVKTFKGIGNFVNLIEIDDAISLGLQVIDFLQNNYQWKSRWFSPIPLYKLRK